MQHLIFKYLYPVNKENSVDIEVRPITGDLQIVVHINNKLAVEYYLNHCTDYSTGLSHNELKIAHQVVDVLSSIKGCVRKKEVKNTTNSWETTKDSYNSTLQGLGDKTSNFQKYNKNYILSNILISPLFTSNLLKAMKFCLRKKEYGPLVIGIHGTKGTGKTTLAKAIVEGLSCKPGTARRGSIYHFADPLKKAASELLGVPVEALEHLKNKGERIPGFTFTHREFLQHLGTTFMQATNENWAIELTEKYLKEVHEHTDVVVIPDVRFKHEAQFIKEECSGILIKLSREGHAVHDDHVSEQPIEDCVFDDVATVATQNDSLIVANFTINNYT